MANIKKLFILCVDRGIKDTSSLTDSKARAELYAKFADALSRTGVIRENIIPNDELKEDEDVDNDVNNDVNNDDNEEINTTVQKNKVADKNKNKSKEKNKENKNEPKTSNKKVLKIKFKKQFKFIDKFIEEYDEEIVMDAISRVDEDINSIDDLDKDNIEEVVEYLEKHKEILDIFNDQDIDLDKDSDYLDSLIAEYSKDNLSSFADIGPENIDAFKAYLDALKEDADSDEEEE